MNQKTTLITLGMIALAVVLTGAYNFIFTDGDVFVELDNGDVVPIDSPQAQQTHSRDRQADTEEVFVYETPVESAEDCSELETYDQDRSVCFFECSNEQECDNIEARIEQELENLAQEYKTFSQKNSLKPHNHQYLEEDVDIEAEYTIQKNEQFVLVQGKENLANHQKVIKWLQALSPNDFSDTYLMRLVLASQLDEHDVMAYVSPNAHNPAKWDIVVNMSFFEEGDSEMLFTLIHEFSHILTLNHSQLNTEASQCDEYLIEEGCLYSQSYLNTFYEQFWEGKFDEKSENAEKNYNTDPDAFVSEYAATNPAEDIAESFSYFVLHKKPENLQSITNQKIDFFHQYDELKNIRKDIRSSLKNFVRSRIKSL